MRDLYAKVVQKPHRRLFLWLERDYDSYYEIDLDAGGGPKEGHFQHFHLWYRPYYLRWLEKVKETHVFFGLPYVNVA